MSSVRWTSCLLALPLILAAACETAGTTTVGGDPPTIDYRDKVQFERGLDSKLAIGTTSKGERDGFMIVQVELENPTTVKQVVLYKYEWFDEYGMMVAETDSTWAEAALFPGETRTFYGTAGSKSAADFRFKVKKK